MTERYLDVYVHDLPWDRHAGRAFFHHGRSPISTTFHYREEYLSDAASFALDPSLPLASGAQHVPGIPGAFLDGAPDRWGRNLLDIAHRKASPTGRPTPLVARDTRGRLRVGPGSSRGGQFVGIGV